MVSAERKSSGRRQSAATPGSDLRRTRPRQGYWGTQHLRTGGGSTVADSRTGLPLLGSRGLYWPGIVRHRARHDTGEMQWEESQQR